jgi:antitoxin PrlF
LEVSKISSKGQITVPKSIRKLLKLQEGDLVVFVEENGKVILTKAILSSSNEFQNEISNVNNKDIY